MGADRLEIARQIAEHILSGQHTAWLAVVARNERARCFYTKRGRVDQGLFDHKAPGPEGPITVPSHRYVKAV